MSYLPGEIAVTTSWNPEPEQIKQAQQIAAELGVELIRRPRGCGSLIDFIRQHQLVGMLVVARERLSFVDAAGHDFFFHPSTAWLRIRDMKKGKNDQMIEALALKPGDSVLDCTLGLGSDAIVISYAVGDRGRVVGLEASPVIALIVKEGLARYDDRRRPEVIAAMRRVEVVCTDHLAYLTGLPPRSFDVVYFDPMFRRPVLDSPAINAIRNLANPEPLARESLEAALRVARRRVVVKERRESPEFVRLGLKVLPAPKNSLVWFGILEPEGGGC